MERRASSPVSRLDTTSLSTTSGTRLRPSVSSVVLAFAFAQREHSRITADSPTLKPQLLQIPVALLQASKRRRRIIVLHDVMPNPRLLRVLEYLFPINRIVCAHRCHIPALVHSLHVHQRKTPRIP